jgi:hypothetical protein
VGTAWTALLADRWAYRSAIESRSMLAATYTTDDLAAALPT